MVGSLLAALLLGAACDPNVTIGTRLGEQTGGVGAEGGTTPSASGSAGTATGGEAGHAEDGLVFAADHENGSLSEWDEGPDADAGGYYADGPLPAYSEDVAHSGNGSAKITVDTAPGDQIARLYRRISEREAYYSAWFYLKEDHTPPTWWSIFLFRAVQDRTKSIDLWSVDLERNGDELTLAVYDHESEKTLAVPSKPLVPVGQWFQLQAFLSAEQGQPSQLVLWLDGVEVLRLDDATPAPDAQPLYWVIGNGGSKLMPAVSTVYVDDARISTSFVSL